MSSEQTRKDTAAKDRERNAATENYRPGQLAGVDKSAGSPVTNPSTMPTKPCGDDTSCEMPSGSGVQQRIQTGQASGNAPKAAKASNTPNEPVGKGGPDAPNPSGSQPQPMPRPQPPGRPKGQDADQLPASAGGNAPHDGPENDGKRGGERRKTYEGQTGVSGEAGSAADDI